MARSFSTPSTYTSYRIDDAASTLSLDWSQARTTSQSPCSLIQRRFPGTVGAPTSVLAGVVAATVLLVATLPDRSRASTVKLYEVPLVRWRTAACRSESHRTLAGGAPSTS